MKLYKASKTAQYMALFRALETTRNSNDRLFADSYAIHFLDRGLRLAVHTSKFSLFRKYVANKIQRKSPGAFSSGVARTKYIDDLLQTTIANDVQQIIILGAGFDTRALRLDFLKSIPVIEIDHPNTSDFKIEMFRKKVGELPKNVTYCQIDFNTQSLDELAAQHGFDFTKPTTVIWEGVTNYLTEEAIDKIFAFITKFSESSYVIFTYVHKQILDKPSSFFGGEKLLQDLEHLEERWTFGFLPKQLPGYLKQFNLSLIEDLNAEEYRKKYIPNRTEKGYEFYRVAIAKKEK
jgi:methyltransferase (TIGR00027 family)